MSFYLNDTQSKLIRSVYEAVDDFASANAFTELADAQAVVTTKFRQLEEEFPATAEQAKEYYYADSEDADTPDEQDGYEYALFAVFCSLHGLSQAKQFSTLASVLYNLTNNIYDLSTFSTDYSVERGAWVA